ncbi:MAG: DNA/RNA non-specific endonuclease [Bacteroidales bacterium]|nr:DNA/RNA non-specific endonuclease [Bacteroidales bacterium]
MATKYRLLAIILPLLFVSVACQHKVETEFNVGIKYTEVEGTRGTQWVTVQALSSQQWTLSLSDPSGAAVGWATLDPPSGSGSKSSVTVTWDENDTGDTRVLLITGVSGSQTVTVILTQYPKSGSSGEGGSFPDKIVPDKVYKWMELPATDDPTLYFISHESTTKNGAGRNFSYYWDVNAMVARWVAYPLNKGCIASGSRTNAWSLDPKLPRNAQPVLYSGYRSSGTTGSSDGGTQWYDRGHQCPSADRLAYADNIQTFYGTNMTPQNSDLNSNIWAALETRVRDWSKVFDTLYVVTGCVVDGSTKFVYDNEGKKVTVPTGYYKVLLGYEKNHAHGITRQTGGYTGVAFYLDNNEYPDNDYMKHAVTIDELEGRIGIDFYVNLPGAIGADNAGTVESTKDTYWWTGI